jgi:RNA polymerase sigma factor (TIGR02999 family)
MSEITAVLGQIHSGASGAADRLFELVYAELKGIAAGKMAREAPGQTLQPTALVHEAWLRLGGDQQPTWENKAHFFSSAAEAMRRILIDRARRRLAARRGAGAARVPLDDIELPIENGADDGFLLDLDEALQKFAAKEPRKCELVKLRYFVGLSHVEAAEALGIAVPTAKQWWAYSRAWLTVEIRGEAR